MSKTTADYFHILHDVYTELHSLVKEQRELLGKDRFAEFLAISSKISKLQQRILSLQKRFLSSQNKLRQGSKHRETKEHISSIQKSIEELYEDMNRVLAEKKKALLDEFMRLKKGQKSLRVYASNEKASSSRFIEKIT